MKTSDAIRMACMVPQWDPHPVHMQSSWLSKPADDHVQSQLLLCVSVAQIAWQCGELLANCYKTPCIAAAAHTCCEVPATHKDVGALATHTCDGRPLTTYKHE